MDGNVQKKGINKGLVNVESEAMRLFEKMSQISSTENWLPNIFQMSY